MRKLRRRRAPAVPIVEPVALQRLLDESDGPVVVDFFAHWCRPCRLMSPLVERLAAEYPDVRFVRVDIDSARMVAWHYDVRAVPTVLRFDARELTAAVVGAWPYDQLRLGLGLEADDPRQ